MQIIDARAERIDDVVEHAASVVFSGGTLLYPDETGYVVACDPYHSRALERVCSMAGAEGAAQLTLCVASPAELLEFAPEHPIVLLVVKRVLPGPVTLLLRRPPFFPQATAPFEKSVAFRVPSDPLARALLERCGPLIVAPTDYRGEELEGLPRADLLLERGKAPSRAEPSVVDLTGAQPRLLREGQLSFERLVAELGAMERAGTTPKRAS